MDTAFPMRIHTNWAPGTPKRLQVELERYAIAQTLAGRRIGLDPGHGGKDTGAVGVGYKEAEIVLKIGLSLSQWLTTHNALCLPTRKDDIYVPLEKRLSMMLKEQPDVYIGLHTGMNTDRHRRGTVVLHRRDPASRRLAYSLQQAIFKKNPFLVNGGVHPNGEALLSALRIPAVIVLPEYITHHLGEGLLRAVDFQESVTQSLFDGLVAYFHPSP